MRSVEYQPLTCSTSSGTISVEYDLDGEPDLVGPAGHRLETWREDFPYPMRMTRPEYDRDKREQQIELLKLQDWVKKTGARVMIIFEGRDAAGKGGTIKRFTQHLNPRGTKVVALDKPTEREQSQWYFQRYIQHLPSAGEIVLFDRSWYNRAGVERVMGFCTEEQYVEFMRDVPELERMLVRSGLHLIKFWFSVARSEQRTRFAIRQLDPVRQWKLSPTDIAALDLWDAYTGGERGDVRRDGQRRGAVGDGEEQRQETGPRRGHAVGPVELRLHRQGLRHRGYARSADRHASGGIDRAVRASAVLTDRSASSRREPLRARCPGGLAARCP